jgi:hypothetical protein
MTSLRAIRRLADQPELLFVDDQRGAPASPPTWWWGSADWRRAGSPGCST